MMFPRAALLLACCTPAAWAVGPPVDSPPRRQRNELRACEYLVGPAWSGQVIPLDLRPADEVEKAWRLAVRQVFDYLGDERPDRQRQALQFLTAYAGLSLMAASEESPRLANQELIRLAFGRHGAPCRRRLARLLASKEKDIAATAAALLLRIDPRHAAARRRLTSALTDDAARVRESAWESVAQLRLTCPEVVRQVKAALADPSEPVRRSAVYASFCLGPKAGNVAGELLELHARPDPARYQQDIMTYGRGDYSLLALAAMRDQARPAIEPLVKLLRALKSPDESNRGAGRSFVLFGLSSEEHLRLLCHTIAAIAPPRQIPIRQLEGLLTSRSSAKRLHAAALLLRAGPDHQAALQVVRRALGSAETDKQAAALEALAACSASPPALLPLLRAGIKSEDSSVRIGALRALGGYGPKAVPAVPELMRFLKHGRYEPAGSNSSEEERLAARALGQIGPKAQPLLIALVRDPKAEFRHEALDELGRQSAPTRETCRTIVSLLEGPEELLGAMAIPGAGRFGPAARAAVPALRRLVANSKVLGQEVGNTVWPSVAIDWALRQIEGHWRPLD